MYCKKCGAKVILGGKFCPKCGSADIYEKEIDDKHIQSNDNNCQLETKAFSKNNTDTNPGLNIKVFGIVILLIIIVCAVGSFFYFSSKNKKTSTRKATSTDVTTDINTPTATHATNENESIDEKKETDSNGNTYRIPSDVLDFYGIWCGSTEFEDEAITIAENLADKGFSPKIVMSSNWSNLESVTTYYLITSGIYNSKSEANSIFMKVQELYPNAVVKYSGSFIEQPTSANVDQDGTNEHVENLIEAALNRELTESDLKGYSSFELSAARNGLYAYYGYIFQSEDWYNYFISNFDWYTPDKNVTMNDIGSLGNKNAEIIKNYEEKTFGSIYTF